MSLTKTYLNKLYELGQNDKDIANFSYKGSVKPSEKADNVSMASPLMRKELTESVFEDKIKKTEQKKEQELYNCRESHYIKRMMQIIFSLMLYGIIVMLWLDPMFMFMHIYRRQKRHYLTIVQDDDIVIEKFRLTTNEMVFLIVNWIELAYMYYVWKQLSKINQDQLNIKNELLLTTVSWIIFSTLYFVSNL